MKCFVGVDGGGTHTSIRAYNLDGQCVAKNIVGGINYNFISTDAAADRLVKGILSLRLDGEILSIGLGDPSIDENSLNSKTKQFKTLLQRALGDQIPIYIKSDAFMSLYGHTQGQEGLVIISGTGAIGLACDCEGVLYTLGGWGRLTGDEGSAYYIALAGIKAALRHHDGIGEQTTLSALLPSYFGCKRMRGLIDLFYASPEPEIASFAKIISEQAQQGDEVSHRIIKKAAWYLAAYAEALVKWLYRANPNYENKAVGIYGSVLTKNKLVRHEFETLLQAIYPDTDLVEPDTAPEAAAALYAASQYQNEDREEVL